MTANELLEIAIKETKNLKVDERFVLKDLFKGYEWKRLNQGVRSTLGILFLNYVESNPSIEIVKSTGQKEYVKIQSK